MFAIPNVLRSVFLGPIPGVSFWPLNLHCFPGHSSAVFPGVALYIAIQVVLFLVTLVVFFSGVALYIAIQVVFFLVTYVVFLLVLLYT